MSGAYLHTFAAMGTVVTIHIVSDGDPALLADAAHRAAGWFELVEHTCTRFDTSSEVMRLGAQPGVPVRVSDVLLEAVQFACWVADDTGGAFDPVFDPPVGAGGGPRASYREVRVDSGARTIMLDRPLILDLGAVAKGLAVDLAVRELGPFGNFVIDAGGDLYCAGHNAAGRPWSVGIRHPRDPNALITTLEASGTAVCTSGDYERGSGLPDGGHHIVDPRTRQSATGLASVTVVAPTAMVADALGTAAFVLGPVDGVALLERHGVAGLLVTPSLARFETGTLARAVA